MAVAVDASTPTRFNGNGASGTSIASLGFTAPANSFLVLCIQHDGNLSSNGTLTTTPSLTTGSALVWTLQPSRDWNEGTDGGAARIYTAPAVVSELRVVSVLSSWSAGAATNIRRNGKLYVVTGADISGTPVDSLSASNESTSATNNYTTPALTPGADGLIFGSDCDWTAGAGTNAAFEAPSDGSTQDTTVFSGEIAVCSGYKACTAGVAVTMNFNAGSTGAAQHKECRIIVRVAPAAVRRWLLGAR